MTDNDTHGLLKIARENYGIIGVCITALGMVIPWVRRQFTHFFGLLYRPVTVVEQLSHAVTDAFPANPGAGREVSGRAGAPDSDARLPARKVRRLAVRKGEQPHEGHRGDHFAGHKVTMSSFTAPLIAEKIGPRLWRTYREFYYCVGAKDSKERIVVPAGFKTDFASIPRVFWLIFPPDGEYTQAAVLHDHLCEEKRYPKLRVSEIFHEAMLVLGVGRRTARLMFLAVQWFGPDW